MQNKYLLSIDYGSQSVRALVFDHHGQLIVKVAQQVSPYNVVQLGWAEQDVDYCWQQVCLVLRKLWSQTNITPSQITALTITTQRNCVINLDKHQNALRPMIMWPDSRRATKFPKLKPWWRLAFMVVGMTKRIRYFQGESELNWIAQHEPNVYNNTDKVCFLSGYLNFKLTGELKDSVASQVGFVPFDYKNRCWGNKHNWQWQAIDIKPSQMIEVIEPGEVLGLVSPSASEATGLINGIAVISAGADKACETLTATAASTHVASVSLGTAATINITQTKYREAFRYLPAYPSLTEQSYINEIILQRGFWLLSHFIEQYGEADSVKAKSLGISTEELICRAIADIEPGCDGLLLQPFWAPGVIYPGPEARGSIVGFTPDHSRLHLYRALIEGILFALKQGLERLSKIAPETITVIRISGGGSQSDVVMQMAADIFNLPCERVQTFETSGLGAAIACAKGAGIYQSIEQGAKAMVKIGRRFEPSEQAPIYQDIYRRKSKNLYRYLKPFYNKY
ncbi:MAG: carbohydrate kinase [Psychrobium sp.]|nr:carbohydrate kinase [Psychrobium sp.]